MRSVEAGLECAQTKCPNSNPSLLSSVLNAQRSHTSYAMRTSYARDSLLCACAHTEALSTSQIKPLRQLSRHGHLKETAHLPILFLQSATRNPRLLHAPRRRDSNSALPRSRQRSDRKNQHAESGACGCNVKEYCSCVRARSESKLEE